MLPFIFSGIAIGLVIYTLFTKHVRLVATFPELKSYVTITDNNIKIVGRPLTKLPASIFIGENLVIQTRPLKTHYKIDLSNDECVGRVLSIVTGDKIHDAIIGYANPETY
jgi:hypothetical protein